MHQHVCFYILEQSADIFPCAFFLGSKFPFNIVLITINESVFRVLLFLVENTCSFKQIVNFSHTQSYVHNSQCRLLPSLGLFAIKNLPVHLSTNVHTRRNASFFQVHKCIGTCENFIRLKLNVPLCVGD